MFLQGTDPSSCWRATFCILCLVATSPESGGNTPKHPQKQGGGQFSGAAGGVGRAGFHPAAQGSAFCAGYSAFPPQTAKPFPPSPNSGTPGCSCSDANGGTDLIPTALDAG